MDFAEEEKVEIGEFSIPAITVFRRRSFGEGLLPMAHMGRTGLGPVFMGSSNNGGVPHRIGLNG